MTSSNIALVVSALGPSGVHRKRCDRMGAQRQARKAATLVPRTEAINHIRQAHFDVTNNGYVTGETVNHIPGLQRLAGR